MVTFEIPDFGRCGIAHLVFDYNGTLACDGNLIKNVRERLIELSKQFTIHVITADTFGNVRKQLEAIPCKLSILPARDQALAKEAYVIQTGAHQTVALGNGRNDRLMLRKAVIGIAVLQTEGAAGETILHADIVVKSITDALELLQHPLRLKATLRS